MAAAADTDASKAMCKKIQDSEAFIKANVQMGTMDQNTALSARLLVQALYLEIPLDQFQKTIMGNAAVFRELRSQNKALSDEIRHGRATIAAQDKIVQGTNQAIKRHLQIQRKLRDQLTEARAAAPDEDAEDELSAATLSKLAEFDQMADEAHGGADQTTEAAHDDATRRRSNVGQAKPNTYSFKKAGSFLQDDSGSGSDSDSDDDSDDGSEDKDGGKEEEGGYEPAFTMDDGAGEVNVGMPARVRNGNHHVHFDHVSNDSERSAAGSVRSASPTLSLSPSPSHADGDSRDSRDSLPFHDDSQDGTGTRAFAAVFNEDDSKAKGDEHGLEEKSHAPDSKDGEHGEEENHDSDDGDDGLDMGFMEDEAAAGKNAYIEIESDSQSGSDTDDSDDRNDKKRMLAEIAANKAAKKAARAKAKAETKAKAAEAKANPAKMKTAARSAGSTAIKTEYVGQAAARAEPAKTAERPRKKARTRPYVDPCMREGAGISELTGPGSTTGARR
jgi:hypothetical protein